MNQSLNLKPNVQIVDFGGHWGRIPKLFYFSTNNNNKKKKHKTIQLEVTM